MIIYQQNNYKPIYSLILMALPYTFVGPGPDGDFGERYNLDKEAVAALQRLDESLKKYTEAESKVQRIKLIKTIESIIELKEGLGFIE